MVTYLKKIVFELDFLSNQKMLLFCLLTIAFNLFLYWGHLSPKQDYLFANYYDGSRNYYALKQYVQSELPSNSFFKLEDIFYPYGEYVLYTDNTPCVAIPLKFLGHYFPSLKNYTFQIFHFYLVILFIFCSILFYKLLQMLKVNYLWSLIAALVLPSICPQFLRLVNGHMNLATPIFIVFPIVQFTRYYQEQTSTFGIWKWMLSVLFYGMACLTHIYLPVLSIAVLLVLVLIEGVLNFSSLDIKQYFKKGLYLCSTPIVAFIIIAIFYGIIDEYSSERLINGAGFNWVEWNLVPEAIINAYDWNIFKPLDYISFNINGESNSYVGSFALLGILVLIFYRISKYKTAVFTAYNERMMFCFLIASLLFYIVAIGIDVHLFNRSISFKNYLNPFFYLVKISDVFTQFRTLARFNWPIFWLLNLVVLYSLNQIVFNTQLPKLFRGLIFIFPILILIDGYSFYQREELIYEGSNVFSEATLNAQKELIKDLNLTEFQAILPLPIFVAGASNMNYNIDPQDGWAKDCYRFNMITSLPIISGYAGRISEKNAESIMSFVTSNPKPDILQKLKKKEKDILVIKSKLDSRWNLNLDHTDFPKKVMESARHFPETKQLEWLKENDKYIVYRYRLQYQ